MKSYVIHLIRNMPCQGNLEGRYIGRTESPLAASSIQDLLELNGYTVDVCHDGESGLDNALTSIYDVILLDVMLPKMDGFEVCQHIREFSDMPIVMLTAKGDGSSRTRSAPQARAISARVYLSKIAGPPL